MSRPVQEKVVCPDCKTESAFTAWTSLNVTLDPAQKESLLSGALFRFTCPSCGAQSQIVYPMLYHDMERQFMIWMVPPDESGRTAPPQDPGRAAMHGIEHYTFRLVASLNELYEKILTFDAQLDDYTIEMVKLAMAAQMPEPDRSTGAEVYFAELEPDPAGGGGEVLTFAVVTPSGTKGARVPREPVYSSMQKAVAELTSRKPASPPGEWPRVNAEHLMSLTDLSERAEGDAGGESGAASHSPPQSPSRPQEQKKPWWKPW